MIPNELPSALLLFPPLPLKLVPLAIVALNWAIWLERTYHLKHCATPPPWETTSDRLFHRALGLIPVGPKRATSRSVVDFLAAPHPNTALFFTDGSAIPNPGPSGAGVFCQLPPSLGGGEIAISVSTGENSNNIGEMTALLAGAAVASALTTDVPNTFAAFFSDSAISIGHILHGWAFGEDIHLGRETRLAIGSLIVSKRASLDWVRGHDNIMGNDRADALAKTGARSAMHLTPIRHFRASFPRSLPRLLVRNVLSGLRRFGFISNGPPT